MKHFIVLLFIVSWLFPKDLFSQCQSAPPITLEDPSNSLCVHLYYLMPDSYQPELAASTIYGVEDSLKAQRLAIKLKQVLDGKGLYVRFRQVPQEADYREDTIPNQYIYTLFPEELPEVYMERIDDRWYYSEETVAAIPALHKTIYPFGADLLLNLLPKVGHSKVLGLALWQYFGLALLLVLIAFLQYTLSRILKPIVRWIGYSRLTPSKEATILFWKLARFISLFLIVRLLTVLVPPLQLPIAAAEFTSIVIKILSAILIVLILLRTLDVFILYAGKFTEKTESKLDEQLLPILMRTFQVIIVIGGIIPILRIFKVDFTTLIAGISIGGLALALAAQDTLKNLFGSLMVFLDRPFQIGDWISFSGVDGTVEEVGFRSTRVRTFANSLVSVPNGKLVDMTINNYGVRVYRRFKANIAITYDTPTVLIEKFVEGLREIVANYPDTRKDYYEVHLNNMGDNSLDILFYIFFSVPSWSGELEAKHDIIIAIIELAEELGVSFAFPSSSVYIEQFPEKTFKRSKRITEPTQIDAKMAAFMEKYKNKVQES
ncbi:MAG: mechanosensitive ion channel family protein [Bacteroidetes bacterium]|nr:mechanosensitive ion channel family protein [Bacteroidota bacterium]